MDDSRVSSASLSSVVLNQKPYILFYKAKGSPQIPAEVPKQMSEPKVLKNVEKFERNVLPKKDSLREPPAKKMKKTQQKNVEKAHFVSQKVDKDSLELENILLGKVLGEPLRVENKSKNFGSKIEEKKIEESSEDEEDSSSSERQFSNSKKEEKKEKKVVELAHQRNGVNGLKLNVNGVKKSKPVLLLNKVMKLEPWEVAEREVINAKRKLEEEMIKERQEKKRGAFIDDWDATYDKGRVKKVREKKDKPALSHNPFQLQSEKKRKFSKLFAESQKKKKPVASAKRRFMRSLNRKLKKDMN